MNHADLVKKVQAHDNTEQGLSQDIRVESISREKLSELSQGPAQWSK